MGTPFEIALGVMIWSCSIVVAIALGRAVAHSGFTVRWPELARRYNRMANALSKLLGDP